MEHRPGRPDGGQPADVWANFTMFGGFGWLSIIIAEYLAEYLVLVGYYFSWANFNVYLFGGFGWLSIILAEYLVLVWYYFGWA